MRATFGEDADAFPVFKVLEHGVVDTGLVHFPQFLKERGGGREGGGRGPFSESVNSVSEVMDSTLN